MRLKKLLAAGISVIMTAAALTVGTPASRKQSIETEAASGGKYDYAEALQKSLFFYEVQQAGVLPEWNSVPWRADCMVNDYINGGWFDAGDHFKFSNTIAYSATLLGWGLYEYKDGVAATGALEQYENNLKWGFDYLVNCDMGDGTFIYCIGPLGGDGSFDHKWWGSAEVYMIKYLISDGETQRAHHVTKNCSIAAQMSAALAVGASVFKDSDPQLSAKYLQKAVTYFNISYDNRESWAAMKDGGDTPALGNMYKNSSFWDDIFLAANWLYVATGDQKYLDFCETQCVPNVPKEGQIDALTFQWGYCWDHVWPAAFLMYAKNTGSEFWAQQVTNHLDYWTTGYMGTKITYTADGLAWLFNWGALRHATTTAFLAMVASESIYKDNTALRDKYTAFAERQMNYCFGDNANNFSYVVGMGNKHPMGWHHRTSSGVWDDKWSSLGSTKEHAHVLYGALVGGPDSSGKFSDSPGDYQYTEVAIDYNAGYTAALCAMVNKYGGKVDPNFPPIEEPKWDEFYIDAKVSQNAANHTAIKLEVHNHSAWPARVVEDLSFNYYVDLSEAISAGIDPLQVEGRITYHGPDFGGGLRAASNPKISGPHLYKDNVYYFKVSMDGTWVLPAGQSEERWEFQFRMGWPDGNNNPWDTSNDHSFKGISSGEALTVTNNITMYDGSTLIWGEEPDGTVPVKPDPTTKPTAAPTTNPGPPPHWGDANCDSKVDIGDVIKVRNYVLSPSDVAGADGYISPAGKINANVAEIATTGVNVTDALAIQRALVGGTLPLDN